MLSIKTTAKGSEFDADTPWKTSQVSLFGYLRNTERYEINGNNFFPVTRGPLHSN